MGAGPSRDPKDGPDGATGAYQIALLDFEVRGRDRDVDAILRWRGDRIWIGFHLAPPVRQLRL